EPGGGGADRLRRHGEQHQFGSARGGKIGREAKRGRQRDAGQMTAAPAGSGHSGDGGGVAAPQRRLSPGAERSERERRSPGAGADHGDAVDAHAPPSFPSRVTSSGSKASSRPKSASLASSSGSQENAK